MFDYSTINFNSGVCSTYRSSNMGKFIQEASVSRSLSGMTLHYKDQVIPTENIKGYCRMPVVISVMGVGTSGKNTFTGMIKEYEKSYPDFYKVVDVSIMDPIFDVADRLINTIHTKALKLDPEITAHCDFVHIDGPTAASEKEDDWRQLVHDLKMSWQRYNSSAVLNIVLDIIKEAYTAMLASTADKSSMTSIFFVQNRDRETVDELEAACHALGIIHLRLRITNSQISPDAFTNDGDRLANTIPADITIDNSGTLDDLKQKAQAFMDIFHAANGIYGIPANAAFHEDPIYDNLRFILAETNL